MTELAPVARHSGPHPFWATFSWGLAISLTFVVVTIIVVMGSMIAAMNERDINPRDHEAVVALAEDVGGLGTTLGLSTTFSGLVAGLLVLLAIRLRRGISVTEYLALRSVPWRTLGLWMLVAVVSSVIYDLVWPLLGVDAVPEFMLHAMRTGGRSPWLWIGVVVVAPLFEEVFCRGFLLTGWRRSVLGPWGAVILISLLWALAHQQYGMLEMLWIFLLGVVLGVARLRTGSIWTPVAMHMVVNFGAMVQGYWVVFR